MKMRYASAAVASLLALFVAGCASTQPAAKPEAAPAQAAKPALTDEAKQALAAAEADVAAAKKAFTLWIPAENALKSAQDAAKEGDSATVIKQAKKAMDLNKLAAAQKDYPSTELQ